MTPETTATIMECTTASDEDRMAFPEVVARLLSVGIERYHADLVRGEKTYYLPDGRSRVLPTRQLAAPPAPAFSPTGIEAAVRAIQAGRIGYGSFCAAIAAAGCVGYTVSLAGRRAVYSGRTAESFVEPFPAPK